MVGNGLVYYWVYPICGIELIELPKSRIIVGIG